jgi:hypothetical protein
MAFGWESKTKKLQIKPKNIHVTIWEGKSISLNQEKELKWRACDLKGKGASHGPRQESNSIVFQFHNSPN